MSVIGVAVANIIDQANITNVSFSSTDSTGNVYIDVMPYKPVLCVAVTQFGVGYEPATGVEHEKDTELQVRFRGNTVSEASAMAEAVCDALWAYRDGGTVDYTETVDIKVIKLDVSGPTFMGVNVQDKPEYVARVSVRWLPIVVPQGD